MNNRFGHNLHQRNASAVKVNERIVVKVIEFPDILLEVNPVQFDKTVLAHDISRRSRKFEFDLSAEADRLIVLRDLIIFWIVRIKIVFPIPFADRGDFAAEQKARSDNLIERLFVHDRQRSRQSEDDRIGLCVRLGTEAARRAAKHFRFRLNLNVNLESDDYFVFHGKSWLRRNPVKRFYKAGCCFENGWDCSNWWAIERSSAS